MEVRKRIQQTELTKYELKSDMAVSEVESCIPAEASSPQPEDIPPPPFPTSQLSSSESSLSLPPPPLITESPGELVPITVDPTSAELDYYTTISRSDVNTISNLDIHHYAFTHTPSVVEYISCKKDDTHNIEKGYDITNAYEISHVITNQHWTLEEQDAGGKKQDEIQSLSVTKTRAEHTFDQSNKETTQDIDGSIYSIPIIVDQANNVNTKSSSVTCEYQEPDDEGEIVEYNVAYGIQSVVPPQPSQIP